jgi:uncharacterized delta-60 repeat protein
LVYAAAFAVWLGACGFPKPADVPGDGTAILALAKASRWVPQSGSTPLAFTIVRGATVTGALTVHITGLPAGVTAADIDVAASDTTGTIALVGSAQATLGSVTSVDVTLSDTAMTYDTKPFVVKVSGAPGTLDTTFGDSGLRVLPLPDPAIAAATGNAAARSVVQYPATAGADAGKIVIAADLQTSGASSPARRVAVARFNPDGTVDTSFGGGKGYVLKDYTDSIYLLPVSVVLDSQNRIVIATARVDPDTACYFVADRLTADGDVDGTFVTYNVRSSGQCGTPTGMATIAGDQTVEVGIQNNPDASYRPLLLALDAAGGTSITAFGGTYTRRMPNPDVDKPMLKVAPLVVDSQGRYVMPGYKCAGANTGASTSLTDCVSVVTRVKLDGEWDTTFGANRLGYAALTFGSASTPKASNPQSFQGIAFDADGKLVVVGTNEDHTTGSLARFDGTTGEIDTGFGTGGAVAPVLVAGGVDQGLSDVVIDEDGRIIAVGHAASSGPLTLATRYTSAGVLDTTYGIHGVGSTPSASLEADPGGRVEARARAVLQPDGRLVVVGAYPRAGGYDVALWRFWP